VGVTSRQIPAFDGIRGVAIFWVVLHNATSMPLAPSGRWLHLFPLLTSRGWIGVQLFFALSGFLITKSLLETQGQPGYFRNFYARRALRIVPLYYTVLVLLLLVLPGLGAHVPYRLDHQAPLWLFTANWTRSFPYGFGHFWSLAVEEQFYLLWPLVVFRLAPRRLLTACLWIALAALVVRCVLAACGTDPGVLYGNTACRMDALALGGAGACLLRIPQVQDAMRTRQAAISAAALLVFLAGIPFTRGYDIGRLSGETLGYTLLALSTAAFVSWVALPGLPARNPIVSLLVWGPLRSCGKYSYGIYVFHNLLHILVGVPWLTVRFGKQLPVPVAMVYVIAVLLVSCALAFCSYHLLEKHFLRLKRFFEPRVARAGVS